MALGSAKIESPLVNRIPNGATMGVQPWNDSVRNSKIGGLHPNGR